MADRPAQLREPDDCLPSDVLVPIRLASGDDDLAVAPGHGQDGTHRLRQAGASPQGIMELDHIEAATRMVERGLGVARLPGTAVADALRAGTLRRIALAEANPIRRRIVAVARIAPAEPSAVVDASCRLLERIPSSCQALSG